VTAVLDSLETVFETVGLILEESLAVTESVLVVSETEDCSEYYFLHLKQETAQKQVSGQMVQNLGL